MNNMTEYEREVLRARHAAASAPWWARVLWGRDVYHPRLRVWRALRAVVFVGAVVIAAIPYSQPWNRVAMSVWVAIGVAAIIVRWRALG